MTSPSSDSEQGGLFTGDDLADLIAIARALYPHKGLSDGPYTRSVTSLLSLSARDPQLFRAVREGLIELRRAAGVLLGQAAEERLRELLGDRQTGEFFARVRAHVAFTLYDDHEVWEHIGYPGASFHLGGYLHRGFNDLDWLPEPRIEESGEPAVEIGPLPYPSGENALKTGVLQ